MTVKNPWPHRMALMVSFFSTVGWIQAEPSQTEALGKLPPILAAKPLDDTPRDDAQQKLLKELYNVRQAITATYYKDFWQRKQTTTDLALDSARQLLRTGMELYQRPEDQLKLLKQMSELPDRLDKVLNYYDGKGLYAGRVVNLEHQKVRVFKLEIELKTLKVKKAAGEK